MRQLYFGLNDPIQAPEQSPVPANWQYQAETIQTHLQALGDLLVAKMPQPQIENDQGMVIVGGGKFLEGMIIAVKMLRECGSTMPVQIWHRGDLEPIPANAFDGIDGVSIIDSLRHAEMVGGSRIMRGWEQKLHALVHSNFQRILYLDADAYPVDNPAPFMRLLDKAPFVFWSDLPGNYATVKWHNVWPSGDQGVPAIQGGQLAIDRLRCWRTLMLAHFMNQHSDFYYSHMFGDQDTWRVALAAQKDPSLWHNIGAAPWVKTAFVCGVTPEKPLIVHRCQGKLFRPEHIPHNKQAYSSPKWELPKEAKVFALFSELLKDINDSQKVFGQIYDKALWGDQSGPGSDITNEARPYVDLVNTLIEIGGFQSVVDLGCGDGRVGRALRIPEDNYIGVDCHLPHIQRLRSESFTRQWIHADIFKDRERLPSGEICLLKDVLHHWPNSMVIEWLTWARACKKWQRVLLTQDCGQHKEGADTYLGGYRALHPTMEPLKQFKLKVVVPYLHKAMLMMNCNLATK